MAALEAGQVGNVAVVGGEELRERQQVVDQGLDRARPQHGGAGVDVPQQGGPDRLGHGDVGEALLQRSPPGAASGWLVEDGELEQYLAQAGQARPVRAGRGTGHGGHLLELNLEALQILGVQRCYGAAGNGQDDSQTLV